MGSIAPIPVLGGVAELEKLRQLLICSLNPQRNCQTPENSANSSCCVFQARWLSTSITVVLSRSFITLFGYREASSLGSNVPIPGSTLFSEPKPSYDRSSRDILNFEPQKSSDPASATHLLTSWISSELDRASQRARPVRQARGSGSPQSRTGASSPDSASMKRKGKIGRGPIMAQPQAFPGVAETESTGNPTSRNITVKKEAFPSSGTQGNTLIAGNSMQI